MSSGFGEALGLGLAAAEADGAVDAGADGDGLVAAGVQAPTTIITEATRLRPLRVRRLIVLLLIASSGNVCARSCHGRNTDTLPGPHHANRLTPNGAVKVRHYLRLVQTVSNR